MGACIKASLAEHGCMLVIEKSITDNDSDFLDDMLALGLRASMMDERVAAAMSLAGFSQSEIVDFLVTSEWPLFYGELVRAHHLPCTPAVAMAMRKAFDAASQINGLWKAS